MPDFDALGRALLDRARDLLPRWLPGGRLVGNEWVCGDLRGGPGDSLKINIQTGKWADFATSDKGGDLTSLYAAIEGISQGEAAKRLSGEYLTMVASSASVRTPAVVSSKPEPVPLVVAPPPADAPAPGMEHIRYGKPSASWCYRDSGGLPLFYVARYDMPEGKQIVPWSWLPAQSRWIPKAFPEPRPLYGLELLAARPKDPVMIVEGEKAADAARRIAGEYYVVMTWPGGARAIRKCDWRPLAGRRVLIWPDADDPGMVAGNEIAGMNAKRCKEVKILNPSDRPAGWDAADALLEGWDWDRLVAWARPRAQIVGKTAVKASKPLSRPSARGELVVNCTDLGNARRLVARHGERMRYCYSFEKWCIWNDLIWAEDKSGEASRLAKDTIMAIYDEAAVCEDYQTRQDLIKHALKSEAAGRIASMLTLAESEPGIPVLSKDLDTNPWLMGVQNGTLDLRTGELRAPRREDFITKSAGARYDPDATCPTWESFLDRVMDGKRHLVEFLQRAVGYALTANTSEQVIFFLHGVGANGKSTFIETVRAVMGDYAIQTQTSTLMVKERGGGIPNDIARLHGARFVAAVEADEGMRLSESTVKQLTGDDMISARFLHAEFFDFKPTHKIFLAANHKPVIRGTDYAIWRRIRLVPFGVTIPPEERDRRLPEKLRAEAAGILAWAMRGCLDWQENGLGLPAEVEAATEEYRSEMDALAAFLADECVQILDARVRANQLYEAYKAWCERTGEYQLTQTRFGRKLAEKGFRKEESHGMWYVGLGLNGKNEPNF